MTDEFIARHRRVRGRDFGANDIAAAALPASTSPQSVLTHPMMHPAWQH